MTVSKEQMIIDKQNETGDKIDLTLYIYPNKINNLTTFVSNNKDLPNQQEKESALQQERANITVYATSSISKYGYLWKMTSKFEKNSFIIDDNISLLSNSTESIRNTFELSPTKDVIPGNYTLTIGARYNNDITYSKVIDLQVI